ncbi:MAG: hypothetical protein M0R70_06855 [Nitrospirae bacterium]|nr:hypothetical protein [Nitrospirota bacterium]
MHTLFDFISNVNAVQYVIALLSVVGFIVFSEVLKARPFEGLRESVAEDVRFIKAQDKVTRLQLAKNVAMAPFYFLSYLAALPVLFAQGMAEPIGRGIGAMTTGGWSPVRAYFAGRRKTKKSKGEDSDKRT